MVDGTDVPAGWIPPLTVHERLRPVDLVAPLVATALPPEGGSLPRPAAYAALEGRPVGDVPAVLSLEAEGLHLTGRYDPASGGTDLEVTTPGLTTQHRSRRHGRTAGHPTRVALTLTGPQVTFLTLEDGRWLARARYDLGERCDVGAIDWSGLLAAGEGVGELIGGGFGQLGLRDVRLVSDVDGSPVVDPDGSLWFTATSAGPGFFPTGHTSVWRLRLGESAPSTTATVLEHTGDLFVRRAGADGVRRVYGDHASHLVRERRPDGTTSWLLATSTWADFDRQHNPSVRVVLARVGADRPDPRHGEHVLDADELPLPTDGFTSVGVWDPHLVRTEEGWLVGYVSARKFFRFHPALAGGASLDDLRVLGAATDRVATEGTTVVRLPDPAEQSREVWRVLASDGRDGRRGQREGFPVFDLAMAERGRLDAAYPTNIPWPTIARTGHGWVMVTFNGRPCGGPLVGYGTHGDLVVLREADPG